MRRATLALGIAVAASAVAAARAQQPIAGLMVDVGSLDGIVRDDYYENHVQGGFRIRVPTLGLTIRGENLLILQDLDEFRRAVARGGDGAGLPTRGISRPPSRRQMTPQAMRERLEATLGSFANRSLPREPAQRALGLFRHLYCEGGILVLQDGVEVLRCDRLWISPIDDRVVAENAELRYVTGAQSLLVRGPKLIKNGGRWVGNDVVLTTCTASRPHVALAVGEVEIIERPGEFEVVSRGQTLQLGGANVLPLPDARFFTGSQSEFPIKSVRGGYNSLLGAQFGVVLGLPWNETGGRLHELLTGRSAKEFRGEWELGLGWIENRGTPLDGRLTYSAGDLYEGRTEAFYLDDQGLDIREIARDINRQPIGDDSRGLLRTQNRFFFGERSHVDLQAFHASDPAVYSEFFPLPYRNDELPETSAYLHHAVDNHLITVGARVNLTDFSYRDDRFLSTRFVEELPVATWQWLAEPIAETPFGTPVVLDVESEIGQRRSDYDPRFATPIDDRTLRVDQLAEVSTPFHLGELQFRPYASARGTFYDDTPSGGDETRVALEAGLQIATRLSRSWRWLDEDGEPQSLQHVIAPRITYRNRYHVDDAPDTFFQFDDFDDFDRRPLRMLNRIRSRQLGYEDTDALTERELLRFELRNVFQTTREAVDGSRQPHDLVFLDLAQDVLPNDGRDNGGDPLGLFFYDLLLQPTAGSIPLETLQLAMFGDHDWYRGMQSFDTQLTFGQVLGLTWTAEYRTDRVVDGAVGLGVMTELLGRWGLFAGATRDLDRSEWLTYSFAVQRNDHDWSIALSAAYDPFSDQTTFRIDFLPRLGVSTRRDRRVGPGALQDRYRYDY